MDDESGILKSLRIEWLWPYAVLAGFVALASLVAGLLLHSTILEVAGILLLAATIAYGVLTKPQKEGESMTETHGEDERRPEAPVDSHEPPGVLMFDDYRAGSVVHMSPADADRTEVVPSMKTTRPAPKEGKGHHARQLDIPDFFDFETETLYTDVEPRSEFHSLLDKVLLVVKDVFFANTVAYFWANNEKKEMVLESMASGDLRFMKSRRFPMGEDLVSKVGLTGKPVIVGAVNAASEHELLPYYEEEAGVRSAVCVPVYYANGGTEVSPVGALIIDSLAEDQFGDETLVVLGRFTKLISVLIKSYTDKYDLLLDAELLASIRRMRDRIGTAPTEDGVLEALMDEANRLSTWDSLMLTLYDEKQDGWTIQRFRNKGSQPLVNAGEPVETKSSIVGEVILSNALRVVDDFGAETRPRFHASEPHAEEGSALCVPISSFNRCYGALYLESRRPQNFQKNETETMFRLVQNAAAMLETVYLNDVIKEHVPIDQGTGALTGKHFQRRLAEEVQRASELGAELSLVSIALDHSEEQLQRFGAGAVDAMVNAVSGIVRTNLRSYDVVGRESASRLNVLLIGTPASDAYLWAEKVRKQVAGQVVVSGARSFSTTVSMGICGLLDGMLVDDLAEGTRHVLGKALEHGGNLVRVY
ncbi:MAG TPA: GAF domain-containing protein [Bacteroidota bacterium]|nr:GAF domain-containing protein [Bacteroidota bacterium]